MKDVFARLGADFFSTIVFIAIYLATDNVLLATGVAIAGAIASPWIVRAWQGFMRRRMLTAAVAGRKADDELVQAASGLVSTEYEAAVREAVTHQLLVPDGTEGYVFRHALLREAVYGDLLPGERTRLHGTMSALLADYTDTRVAAATLHPGPRQRALLANSDRLLVGRTSIVIAHRQARLTVEVADDGAGAAAQRQVKKRALQRHLQGERTQLGEVGVGRKHHRPQAAGARVVDSSVRGPAIIGPSAGLARYSSTANDPAMARIRPNRPMIRNEPMPVMSRLVV